MSARRAVEAVCINNAMMYSVSRPFALKLSELRWLLWDACWAIVLRSLADGCNRDNALVIWPALKTTRWEYCSHIVNKYFLVIVNHVDNIVEYLVTILVMLSWSLWCEYCFVFVALCLIVIVYSWYYGILIVLMLLCPFFLFLVLCIFHLEYQYCWPCTNIMDWSNSHGQIFGRHDSEIVWYSWPRIWAIYRFC